MTVQDRYRFLSSIVRIVNSSRLTYPARLKAIARRTAIDFSAVSATVYFYDPERSGLYRRISSLAAVRSPECFIPAGEGIAGLCAQKREIVRALPGRLHRQEPTSAKEREFLAFPIGDGVHLVGVLSLGFEERSLANDFDREFLNLLLEQIGHLIQCINDAESGARKIRNLAGLNDLGQSLNRSLPQKALIPQVLQRIHRYSGACCTFLRVSGVGGLQPVVMRKCRKTVYPYLNDLASMEETLASRVLNNGQTILTTDVISSGPFPPSSLSVPLMLESRLLGAITFFGKQEGEGQCKNFDNTDRELLENMAQIVSGALEGAANYQHMTLLAQEHKKKLKEISLLYRLSNTMLTTISLNKLIHLILTALTSGYQPFFDRAMLFLFNKRSGVLQGMLGVTRETDMGLVQDVEELDSLGFGRWDISEAEMEHQRDSEFSRMVRSTRLEIDRQRNAASRAVLDRRLVHISDIAKETHIDVDFVTRFAMTSFATAPLIAREEVVGIVCVDNGFTAKPISRDDLRFLQLFANQAGMAIENSMLYNRVEDTDRELRETQERLIQGEKLAAIGEMAANIAHELKNPLVAIGGFARRLEKKFAAPSSEHDSVERIVKEVERLEKMLTDILAFSKQARICYHQCSMSDIVEEALATAAVPLQDSVIRVEKHLPKTGTNFMGDPQQMKQVLLNLLFNARDVMKTGGTLEISVYSATLDGQPAVGVSVADTGAGIPQEVLHNIFNPFFTTKDTGTGLGLSIVHRIVDNHRGRIDVTNRVQGGACFNMLIPVEP